MSFSTESPAFGDFLKTHALPDGYRDAASRWFVPLAEATAARSKVASQPLLVGINGCQGSGKTTLSALLAQWLAQEAGLNVVTVSLDDFYLTRSARSALAERIHPLLAVRGVPGTHDLPLMRTTLERLLAGETQVPIPVFDKSRDDRTPRERWHQSGAKIDVLIWEGWCLGVSPQPAAALAAPVNGLEAVEDGSGLWRNYANAALAGDYQMLFSRVDLWVMLAAPGFDCVQRWRWEQEAKLAAAVGQASQGLGASGAPARVMSEEEIRRFVGFYQRLTEWGLATLPPRMDWLYGLDDHRQIVSLTRLASGHSGEGN